MRSRFRFSLATLLLIVTCCALTLGWWSGTQALRSKIRSLEDEFGYQRRPSDDWILQAPITISASESGDFAVGESWDLSVNSAGEAQLTVGWQDTTQSLKISEQQLSELRKALIRERFFELDFQQGQNVSHGSTETLTIALPGYAKTVELKFLMNWANDEKHKLAQPARAVRVWMLIRNWFQHPQAADLRKYDQRVLDAAAEAEKSGSPGR